MRDRLNFCTYERSLAALLFLAIGLASGLTPMQTDTWWQLRAGRDMWQSGHVLLTDIYSHTAYGAFWPNHEWLAEVISFAVYKAGGLPLLTLFAAALIVGGWAITWHLTKGPEREAFVWMALALVPSSLWWEPRPHAFSLLFLPATVAMIVRGRYWELPLLFLVWANCHGGVLLGLAILATGLAVQIAVARRRWWRAGLVLLACALAMSATPLGLSFWIEIPRSLQRIHLYPLDEWRRPRLLELQLLPFWIIAAALCGGLLRHARRLRSSATSGDLTLYACALAVLPMAMAAIRNVGPFLMLAVPAVTSLRQIDRVPVVRRVPQRPVLNAVIVAAAAIGVVSVLAWAYRVEIGKLRWTPVPAPALAALRNCPDNLYNRYDEGGYLLWFAPDRRVFLDGRQDPYPPALTLEHIRMETGGGEFEAVFARYNIHCAYLPTASPVAARLWRAGWTTLYRDERWAVLTDRATPAVPLSASAKGQ